MHYTQLNSDMKKTYGNLYLIGGHEDKEGEKKVLKHILDYTGASRITVIPTASSIPRDLIIAYERAFRDLQIENLDFLDIRTREEADKEEYLQAIQSSELVFFTGGDQVHLLERLGDTTLFGLIRQRWLAGMPIAGTSAGAAAMSSEMIYDGDGIGLYKNSVCHMPGFGFLDGIVVDTHFDVRQRLPRLSQALAAGYGTTGIGLSEDTALRIKPDGTCTVFGNGYVAIITKGSDFSTNYAQTEEKSFWSVHDISFSILYENDSLDLLSQTVTYHKPEIAEYKEM